MSGAPVQIRIEGDAASAQQALSDTDRALQRLNKSVGMSGELFRSQFSAKMFAHALRDATQHVDSLAQSFGGVSKESAQFAGSLANMGVSATISPMLALGQAVGLLAGNLSKVSQAIKDVQDAQQAIGSERQGFFGALFDFQIKTEGQQGAAGAGRDAWHAAEQKRLAAQVEKAAIKQESPQDKILRLNQEFEDYKAGRGAVFQPTGQEVAQREQLMYLQIADAVKEIEAEEQKRDDQRKKSLADISAKEDKRQEQEREWAEESTARQKKMDEDLRQKLQERTRQEFQTDLQAAEKRKESATARVRRAETAVGQAQDALGPLHDRAMLGPAQAAKLDIRERQQTRRQQQQEKTMEARAARGLENYWAGMPVSKAARNAIEFVQGRDRLNAAQKELAAAQKAAADADKATLEIKKTLDQLSAAVTKLLGV